MQVQQMKRGGARASPRFASCNSVSIFRDRKCNWESRNNGNCDLNGLLPCGFMALATRVSRAPL